MDISNIKPGDYVYIRSGTGWLFKVLLDRKVNSDVWTARYPNGHSALVMVSSISHRTATIHSPNIAKDDENGGKRNG